MKPSKEELERLYRQERIPPGKIAKRLGVRENRVRGWMEDYGIPRDAFRKMPSFEITEEQLRDLYISEGLSRDQIAERLDVSDRTVGRWIKSFSLPTAALDLSLARIGLSKE
jgi:DNA-binding XRE family transcriptional regulator